jgi:hypothetical protein
MAHHELSDFIDSIKESLTDARYKEGMELCQKLFEQKQSEEKMYRMTYLRPYMFLQDHCENEDCDDMKYAISFEKVTSYVRLTDRRVERIRETNLFLGDPEAMKPFIDLDLFRSFPTDLEDLGSEVVWDEFPVLALELSE